MQRGQRDIARRVVAAFQPCHDRLDRVDDSGVGSTVTGRQGPQGVSRRLCKAFPDVVPGHPSFAGGQRVAIRMGRVDERDERFHRAGLDHDAPARHGRVCKLRQLAGRFRLGRGVAESEKIDERARRGADAERLAAAPQLRGLGEKTRGLLGCPSRDLRRDLRRDGHRRVEPRRRREAHVPEQRGGDADGRVDGALHAPWDRRGADILRLRAEAARPHVPRRQRIRRRAAKVDGRRTERCPDEELAQDAGETPAPELESVRRPQHHRVRARVDERANEEDGARGGARRGARGSASRSAR
mmetsp:Transcript_5748/g.18934  ORF Transcript_5748/g.18934 Transcript_5748/m.18934 type:complete len:299 (-) Transcript_5748:88-984(-)